MNILITICARGGSKGIPGKNIRELNGIPLIYYTLRAAENFSDRTENNCTIILSTDSSDIKQTVKGLQFNKIYTKYSRPEYLADDKVGKLDVIRDVRDFATHKFKINYDFVLDLDVTSPLRSTDDILNAFNLITSNTSAYNLFSVNIANRNPYFNMVEENKNGFYELCKQGTFLTRQSSPAVFELNASFYIYKAEFFELDFKSVVTNKSIAYKVPHMCFDLDHPVDFEFMEFLIKNDRLDFKFI